MTFKRFAIVIMLILAAFSNSFAQQISHSELIEVMGIQSWRVPSPRHENRQWGIWIVDYAPRKFSQSFNARQLNAQRKALIVLRDVGENRYQFSLKQRGGLSQGELKIDLCSEPRRNGEDCDDNYEIIWEPTPKPFDNGMRFLLAEINQMEQKKYRKQIILELSIIRPE